MFFRTLLLTLFAVIDCVLVYRAVWGPTGLIECSALQEERDAGRERMKAVDADNRTLSREILLLRSDDAYVEKMIRQRLHYLRGNEILYLFGDSAAGSGSSGN